MPDEMRVTRSDGADLWVAVDGSGPPVALCHSGPGLWDYLADLADLLSDEFTVYRWDQRECGRSTAGALPSSMRRTVDDLDELRVQFGLSQWSVLGHSWGAEVALFYALLHRDGVERLGYLSGRGSQAFWRATGSAECRLRTRNKMTEQEIERLAILGELAQRDAGEETEFRYLSWMTDYREPQSSVALAAMVQTPLAINYEVNRRLSRDEPIGGDDLRAACEALEVPILFMHGEDDPRPVEGALLLAEWLPASSVAIVRHAAHLPWVEQPATVRNVLKEFLRSGGRSGS